MPAAPLKVPPALAAIHQKVPRQLGPHICTGPIAVKGAKAGQVLQVDIEAIDVFYDWGYNSVRPLAGALPDDFADNRHIHIMLDRARKSWRLPWGQEVPLAPFFGVMGTAPPPAWGMISTAPPRRNGGNLDNKELVAGPPSTCRFSLTARCSRSATVTASRATARAVSRRSRLG
jgi:acetamidase/formamidase